MRVLWTSQAEADLHSILTYIIDEDPTAAFTLVDAIVESVEGTLSDHPYAGRQGRVAETREWVAHKNYLVAYQVGNDSVEILSVVHAARLWPSQF